MSELGLLLDVSLKRLKNTFAGFRRERITSLFLFLPLGIFLSLGLYFFFHRLLTFLNNVQVIGPILMERLLAMVFFSFLTMLLFSNIVTGLFTLYLSSDLPLLVSSPLRIKAVFNLKFIETLIHSSWMVLCFGLPIFTAYGVVNKASWNFYLSFPFFLLPFLVIPGGLGVIITLSLARLFNAIRLRGAVLLGGTFFISGVCVYLRLLRPEKLVHPEGFPVLIDYLDHLKAPISPYIPSYWISKVFLATLKNQPQDMIFYFLALVSTAGMIWVVAGWFGERLYFSGWSRIGEGSLRGRRKRRKVIFFSLERLTRTFFKNRQVRSLLLKDLRLFFRDNAQWSQIFILLCIIAIYLFSIRNLPFEILYLKNWLSFFNFGFVGFLLAALGARLIYPSLSLEGKSFWIIRSSPLEAKRILREKLIIGFIPLVVVAEVLIIFSNILLRADPFLTWLSLGTVFFLSLGLSTLAVGIGALYPKFEAENPAQIATSTGGIIYMLFSFIFVLLVLACQSWPVYLYFQGRLGADLLSFLSISTSLVSFLALNSLIIFLPLKLGARALENGEY